MKKIMKNVLRILSMGLLISLSLSRAHAADADLLAAAFGGNTQGFEELTDEEMKDTRGGLRNFAFGLFISGDITNLGGTPPDGVDIVTQTPDLVSLNVGLASLANTGGLIQFAAIEGNNNIVNNNMVLNIYILDDGVADTSSLINGSLFGG